MRSVKYTRVRISREMSINFFQTNESRRTDIFCLYFSRYTRILLWHFLYEIFVWRSRIFIYCVYRTDRFTRIVKHLTGIILLYNTIMYISCIYKDRVISSFSGFIRVNWPDFVVFFFLRLWTVIDKKKNICIIYKRKKKKNGFHRGHQVAKPRGL